jgi:cytochrome d ubiquinol oxidase subunit I
MVATGTLISAFWILSANSWMIDRPHHECGRAIHRRRLAEGDNPSFPYRLVHGCWRRI